jgi:hypothetical protein
MTKMRAPVTKSKPGSARRLDGPGPLRPLLRSERKWAAVKSEGRNPKRPGNRAGFMLKTTLNQRKRRNFRTSRVCSGWIPSVSQPPGPVDPPRNMKTFIIWIGWCLLFVLCWPLAILALALFPFVWLISLPLRLMGLTLAAVFALLRALLFLPARIFGGRHRQTARG